MSDEVKGEAQLSLYEAAMIQEDTKKEASSMVGGYSVWDSIYDHHPATDLQYRMKKIQDKKDNKQHCQPQHHVFYIIYSYNNIVARGCELLLCITL